MNKINTHGLKMDGLEEAAQKTGNWSKNCGFETVVAYDVEAGEVWAYDRAKGNYARYNQETIEVATVRHISAQTLADKIASSVKARKEEEARIREMINKAVKG